MNKVYIFSHNKLKIKNESKIVDVNYFKNACIENYDMKEIELIEKVNNHVYSSKIIFEKQFNKNILQNIRIKTIDENLYCEIIHISQEQPLQKFSAKTSEVYIYKNHVQILSDNKFYCYYFNASETNNVIEKNDFLYIFNQDNLLEFNTKIKAFCLKNCKKYAKNNEKIEILCKIPKNNVYFLLYYFDLNSNETTIKQYKNDSQLLYDDYNLPITFFHLIKNNFEDAKNFLGNNINYDDIKNYLCTFDDIWEIDGEYLLSSCSQLCKIKFDIKNNLIIDID